MRFSFTTLTACLPTHSAMKQHHENSPNPQRVSYTLPLYVNLTAAFCLAVLIGLGAYLQRVTYIVGAKASSGFPVLHVDAGNWNVGCTVLGTAVGLLLAWGFASYDDLVTRCELQRPAGVLALYLRPLTARRGWEQARYGLLAPARTVLVLATILSSLMGATTVAVFGVHSQSVAITNQASSRTLDQLWDYGGSVRNPDGDIQFVYTTPGITLISSFLYRSAYIHAMQAKGLDPHTDVGNFLFDSGAIGSTTFPGLNTSGIGLNVSSYIQYSGPGSGYSIPTSFTFERLDAVVFGTVINASCVNATSTYNITTSKYGDGGSPRTMIEYTFTKGKGVSQSVLTDNGYSQPFNIGSYIDSSDNEPPTHAFFFPGESYRQPLAIECTYGGHEVLATVSVRDGLSPLQLNSTRTYGAPLGVNVTQKLAQAIDQYLTIHSHGSPGGSLADGWLAAHYDGSFGDENSVVHTLEQVLGDVGQAYFTLMRQSVEASNVVREHPERITDNGTFVKMFVAVLRVGGSSPGWFAVYGLLFLTALFAAVMSAVQKRALLWRPQDPVDILAKALPAALIGEVMPLRYGGQFEAISRQHGLSPQLGMGTESITNKTGEGYIQ